MINLESLVVLVTRPAPQGSVLCELIEKHHGKAFHFPTLAFAPPADFARLEKTISLLGDCDWFIFMSPRAVSASVPLIRHAWPHWPRKAQLAAVGEGTARALKELGLPVSVHPAENWSSEGLLALSELHAPLLHKIAILRGEGGRELLEKELSLRGAVVLPVMVYQRIMPTLPLDDKVFLTNVIISTSFEGVKNLKTLAGETYWSHLKNTPLIVVSERIKSLACDLGFQTIWVASQASHEAVLNALAQRRNEICQIMKMRQIKT